MQIDDGRGFQRRKIVDVEDKISVCVFFFSVRRDAQVKTRRGMIKRKNRGLESVN